MNLEFTDTIIRKGVQEEMKRRERKYNRHRAKSQNQ